MGKVSEFELVGCFTSMGRSAYTLCNTPNFYGRYVNFLSDSLKCDDMNL